MTDNGIIVGEDQKARCWWCGSDSLYVRYHDEEWGRPVYDDTRLFEKICLEGFQSGLSWLTILRKRENFRAAFDGFCCDKVAQYSNADVERLLKNEGIIRHRGKIEATINNAGRALELIAERGSLSDYFWSFAPLVMPAQAGIRSAHHTLDVSQKDQTPPAVYPRAGLWPVPGGGVTAKSVRMTKEDIPGQTLESLALSKDLKKRGWKFVGPTTCYAFMQAMGMVNDHVAQCAFRNK